MSSPERKHKVLRIVTASSIAALGVAGAAIGKTVIEELSKPKASALEVKQPGGIAPSQKAFNELITVTPSPSPEPSPTVTTQAKPETVKPFDCSILSPEVCALLRPSYRINPDGSRDLLGLVANLPVDTKIFPDITGIFAKTEDSNGKPIGILSNEEGNKRKSTDISGKIEFTGKKTVDGRHINETITTPGATPIAMIVAPPDDPDGFNFSVGFSETERSTAKTIADMERVGRYFPDLETRIPYFVPISTSSNRGVIVTDKFQ